ncbi:hypothetical protein M422DRAFT_23899 [Sphaerobolus stellatus SS14]|nr:hypothetical protein M422DRAFT_23899 [Sphaerobolus stellatus SS14]
MAHEEQSKLPSDPIQTPFLMPNTEEEVNPWASTPDLSSTHPVLEPDEKKIAENMKSMPASTPDEERFTPPPEPPKADPALLNEFDPLATDPVEQHAREAWASAEGHLPPPLPDKDPEVPKSAGLEKGKEKDEAESPQSAVPPQSSPALIPSFPSLASLARSLTARSPKRASTPPLPPPPRSSSLRHAHHASMPAISSNPASPIPPPKPQENLAREDRSTNSPPIPARVSSSPAGSEGQFDFQRFLDQMKMRGAEPISGYLRSFLSNFSKKTFTVKDQIRIIHDFLDFITDKMHNLDGSPWHNMNQQEFDNASEAMEKLVMNRLYDYTFQPLLPPSLRTTDDLERDHVLKQRILLFGWLREEHLDVPKGSDGPGGKEIKGFLDFAGQELLKINHYKAPRDKLICILNSCKVIFGLIRHVKQSEGADAFIPILIYVVLKASPDHLISNIEYISRFRRPEKLQGEAGYYLSSLMGAVSFIETMDHSSLSNITQEEFEKNVELAVESLPEERTPSPPLTANLTLLTPRTPKTPSTPLPTRPGASPLAGEEAAEPLSLPMPAPPREGGPSGSTQITLAADTRRFLQRTSDSISKPLTAIGRIFSEVLDEGPFGPKEGNDGWRDIPGPFAPLSVGGLLPGQAPHTPVNDPKFQAPVQTPYKPRMRPTYSNSPSGTYVGGADYTPTPHGHVPTTNQPLAIGASQPYRQHPPAPIAVPPHQQRLRVEPSPHPSRNPTPTLDFSALQEEIDRAHLAAQDAARETLMQIFPTVDREVADMVLEANDGDLGKSIEGLLEISGTSA